ncbi:nucleotide sugar dehydrogenase [Halorussus salilacus]|uniref:nucleotide sugar dehydrogenase n=1 Tax=Halorussus salilacus TaxID=2953750 RepID=UPI00209E5D08|nr:nucleotide sugar dehydrogenase [Halorussus salilacus]USZ67391.1 nucleotide sugar dehydrogenase [Halorussus salilacus]
MTDLLTRLEEREARVGVIGLGYVGLPLSLKFTGAGYDVAGFDIDADRVASLRNAESYVDDVTDERLAEALESGFTPDDDPSVVADCDAYVIAVPTGVSNGEPEMGAIRSATRTIAEQAGDRETLVVVSSTVYPGATNEEVAPLLHERLDPDRTRVAMVPERLNPGGDYPIEEIPLIVGADDEIARSAACTMFESFVAETYPVDATTTAELAKTLENTYRMVNIALVNELTAFAEQFDADVWDAIAAASTKPFGFQAFYPGPGVGGHCIPIDPQFLTWRASELGTELSLVDEAQRINEWMPSVVVNRIERILDTRGIEPGRASIVTLGLAYKSDVGDTRRSPALEISKRLDDMGDVIAVDPYVNEVDGDLAVAESTADVPLEEADLVVLLVDHRDFDLHEITERASLLFDTRDAVSTEGSTEIVTLGDETAETDGSRTSYRTGHVSSKLDQ